MLNDDDDDDDDDDCDDDDDDDNNNDDDDDNNNDDNDDNNNDDDDDMMQICQYHIINRSNQFNFPGENSVGRQSAGAILYALERVNSLAEFTELRKGDHTLDFTWKDDRCNASHGLSAMVDLWADRDAPPIDAFIGRMNE